jgi:hypothetical protein
MSHCVLRRPAAYPHHMSDEQLVAVSPRHSVYLASELCALVTRPPQKDFVVRTLAKRAAGSLPLMTAEMVIASIETREQFPLARTYPLHFRKTYFPGRMHGDPKDEYEYLSRAAEVLQLPPPIGHTPRTFRTCLIPGTPYSRLSPFGNSQPESNIWKASDVPLATAAGLWRLLEDAFDQLQRLHGSGLAHGDAELHNFIVCPSPLEILPIDFESAMRRSDLDDATWERRCELDLEPLLREAIYVQCTLGKQRGALADLAWARLDQLLKDSDRFREAIEHPANG